VYPDTTAPPGLVSHNVSQGGYLENSNLFLSMEFKVYEHLLDDDTALTSPAFTAMMAHLLSILYLLPGFIATIYTVQHTAFLGCYLNRALNQDYKMDLVLNFNMVPCIFNGITFAIPCYSVNYKLYNNIAHLALHFLLPLIKLNDLRST
jgi:hypothetical protein